MLTADAFGVLPPIARLTPEQAMYHFISGYTAKVAGTEAGVTEPTATFSACFGAPFMVLHPRRTTPNCWPRRSASTTSTAGWSTPAGPADPTASGQRMTIEHTRALLNAALEGGLTKVEYERDPVFGLEVPTACEGVPGEILQPRNTWGDPEAYDAKAEAPRRALPRQLRAVRQRSTRHGEGGRPAPILRRFSRFGPVERICCMIAASPWEVLS